MDTRKTPFFTIYLTDPTLIDRLEKLKWKERKSQSEIGREALLEYIKKHEDGNPNFTLEQFADPNFKACPAFFRDRDIWVQYLNSLDEKGFKEFDKQINLLLNLGNKRFDMF